MNQLPIFRMFLCCALLAVSGCSIEKRSTPGTNPDTEISVGNLTEGDTVIVTLAAPRAAAVGDEVPISIVVENNRDRQIELNLTGREIVFDIIVARFDSTIVWQRLAHANVQQILHLKTLPARGAFTMFDRWTPTEPGEYVIGAALPTDDKPLHAAPINISVR